MKLIKLWEADLKKAYQLQTSFGPNESGFINNAYGYTFAEFLDYVKKCEKTSLGIDLPESYVPATVFILESDEHEYVGIFNLRHKLNETLRNGAGHIGYGISLIIVKRICHTRISISTTRGKKKSALMRHFCL